MQKILISDHGVLVGMIDPALPESALTEPKKQIDWGDEYGLLESFGWYQWLLS